MIKLRYATTRRWGFGGLVEWGGGIGLGERVNREYRGRIGHRLVSDACKMRHQGFFHGNKKAT